MTNRITCQLLGSPKILLDGEVVYFSFSKINALLYYLVVNKSLSRDEAAGILWPEMKEQNAKKNLRNAVYQANKFLQNDVILSPNKVSLVLNQDLDISIDVDDFAKDPQGKLDLYNGEFLKGFFVKEAEEFEYWTVKMRNYYEKTFVEEGYKKVKEDIAQKNFENVEQNISKLIQIDELDERNYRLLMTYHQMKNQHGKVIETYYRLVDTLKSELGINPSEDSRKIYENSLAQINPVEETPVHRIHSLFFGRYDEIQVIAQNIKKFETDNQSKSIIITGEAGVGKSALCNRVLDSIDKDLFVIETQCYQAESKNALRPWKKIIEKMSKIIQKENLIEPTLWQEIISKVFPNFDSAQPVFSILESRENIKIDMLSQIVVEGIRKISLMKKIVFVFEDLQWIDDVSLTLLTSIILDLKPDEAMFMFTLRKEHKISVEYLISNLTKYDKVLTLPLQPFNREESESFIRKKLPDYHLTTEIIDNIYQHTEGNLFFLIEYIQLLETDSNFDIMTTKMKDALKSRFLYLTEEEREVVEVVSFFYDEAPIDLIAKLLEKDILALAETVEKLEKKNILKEIIIGEGIGLQFTHVKLREYIYLNQSTLKKRVLHGRIAAILEEGVHRSPENDSLLYGKLSYHFAKANNELKSLEYKLRYLESNLTFHHELFPTYHEIELPIQEDLPFDREKIMNSFNKIRGRLDALEVEHKGTKEYESLVIKFLYMEGRYLIRYGEYEQGIKDIETVITKGEDIRDKEYVLEGYKQMIYYYIQIENAEGMIDYVEKALDLSIKENNHESIGILLRLKGLYYMMIGNNILAEKLLRESINTFMITEKIAQNYSISIAAAYNYIGEIRHNEGYYREALEMFSKSIELCQENSSSSYLSVFYINSGISAFALENYQEAKEFFVEAYDLYGMFYSYWRRPILDAYMALVNIHEGNFKQVLENILNSRKYSEKMNNPRDRGTVFFAEALIKKIIAKEKMKDKADVKKIEEALPKEADYYCEEALKNLNKYRDKYEINVLEEVFEVKVEQ